MPQFPSDRRRFLQHFSLVTGLLASGWAPRLVAGSPRKLGVALLGLGSYSTEQLAPALQLTQHCELRGIVTGSPEKIPVWQERYGIRDANVYSYDTMHRLADNPDIDVVYVVTPTSLHKKYSLAVANTGKHVWCEKPMAMTADECQEIIDACRKNGVKLSIGYRMQHEPNTRSIMRFAEQKPYGAIEHLDVMAAYSGGEDRSPDKWRMKRDMGGGALYDMGVYTINGSRYATGEEPVAVTARHEVTHPEVFTEVDSTTHLTLEFPSGALAECTTSFVRAGNHLEVTCEEGGYHLRPMSSYTGVQGATSDGRRLDRTITEPQVQQATQMDDNALAIMRDQPVLVPGEEGMRDIRIVEAAFESARQGTRIAL